MNYNTEEQGFGPAVIDKTQGQLYEWTADSGCTYMDLEWDYSPLTYKFIKEQFERFSVPIPENFSEIITESAKVLFYLIDWVDSYMLFWDITDVVQTQDWQEKTYIIDGDELNPEKVETFQLVPGIAEKVFNHCMSHPGLSNLPHEIGLELELNLFSDYADVFSELSNESLASLTSICNQDEEKMKNYFRLATWSLFCWLVSPQGIKYLIDNNSILEGGYLFGECILYEGNVFTPDEYHKVDRPPQSCIECGIQAWCVEETLEDGGIAHICESCTSEGLPSYGDYMCGAKFCKWNVCPHHTHHSTEQGSMRGFMRKHGQLNAASRGQSPQQLLLK